MNKVFKSFQHSLAIIICASLLSACGGGNEKSPAAEKATTDTDNPRSYMKVRKVDAVFEDVRDDINSAITDLGIKINNVSHIGNMLNRTAEAVGATKTVYSHAEAFEFCSSTVSRATMEADPHNIVFCPYIVYVYSLNEDPEHTFVAYRRPLLVGTDESKKSLMAVEALLESVVVEATE